MIVIEELKSNKNGAAAPFLSKQQEMNYFLPFLALTVAFGTRDGALFLAAGFTGFAAGFFFLGRPNSIELAPF
ncbi:MAG TPA: hypothetical protein VNX65_01980 [Patescibacteria group bacterium]|jgi:hypothetical protein|nr:hypothetical protein [Patescibacteria group bacterium]